MQARQHAQELKIQELERQGIDVEKLEELKREKRASNIFQDVDEESEEYVQEVKKNPKAKQNYAQSFEEFRVRNHYCFY